MIHTTRKIRLRKSQEAGVGSGVGQSLSVSDLIEGRVYVKVTAVEAGATGLVVKVQDSPDGTDHADLESVTISDFTNLPVYRAIPISNFSGLLNIAWTVTGAPVTFEVEFVGKT